MGYYTPLQIRKLERLYYNGDLKGVRVIHDEYGEGIVDGMSGDGYLYITFPYAEDPLRRKSALFYHDDKLRFPDLEI